MKSLREFMAQKIADDEMCGGPSIITPEEETAIMFGALLIQEDGDEYRANLLRSLAIDLGERHLTFFQGEGLRPKVDKYYLHCADLVISAYHEWLTNMNTQTITKQGIEK